MSSNLSIDKRRRTYVRLIGSIQNALNRALREEHAMRNLTQQEMADLLHKSKSFISRKMNGTSNMTLETLADLAFALDRTVEVDLRPRHLLSGQNAGNIYNKIPKPQPIGDTSKSVKVENWGPA
jgi:transcriptional regulator with XRE-family HTH domain